MKPKLVKACCQKEENLSQQFSKTNELLDDSDTAVSTCKVCGCRHFRLTVARGKMGSVITHKDRL